MTESLVEFNEVLDDIDEYLDNRAEYIDNRADCEGNSAADWHPNKEMTLLSRLRRARGQE